VEQEQRPQVISCMTGHTCIASFDILRGQHVAGKYVFFGGDIHNDIGGGSYDTKIANKRFGHLQSCVGSQFIQRLGDKKRYLAIDIYTRANIEMMKKSS